MRILLVSGMYPGAGRPWFGVFVADLAQALRERGHEVGEAVLRDPASGPLRTPAKYLRLGAGAVAAARRLRPDVVYGHFLFPPGLAARLAAAAAGAPYVLHAHGADVANSRRSAALRLATAAAVERAGAVVFVSRYLREQLPLPVPHAQVIDCGVDTARLRPALRGSEPARRPAFLFVGSLIERKNPRRLLEAFAGLGRGTLTVVGAGPLEAELRRDAPAGVRFTGGLAPAAVEAELRRTDVLCLPSLVEPLGQAALEALACGRPVVATRVGGPPEYLTPGCGALVDPLDVDAIRAGMEHCATLPVPCEAAVAVARAHDLRLQAERVEAVLAAAVEQGRERRQGPVRSLRRG